MQPPNKVSVNAQLMKCCMRPKM